MTDARLKARPSAEPPHRASAPGAATHPLDLGPGRAALLHVPAGLDPHRPSPLLIMMHGAGGDPGNVIPLNVAEAEARDMLVLAPASVRPTWDVIAGRAYGPDVARLDAALERIFGWFRVSRVGLGGFSDGASYALSVGLANGDLFSDVIAYSPGFAAPDPIVGRPRVFISHGDRDTVLPVERCGRPLSQRLARAGYDVDYREFKGGHTVPGSAVKAALDRFLS